jgi:hypothetical protein
MEEQKKYMVVRFYEDLSAEIVLRDLSFEHAKAWMSDGVVTRWFVEKMKEQHEED